jgi:polygalacturonase
MPPLASFSRLLIVPLFTAAAAAAPGVFSVLDYGGVADGATLNTAAFAAAAAAAHAYWLAGGGPATLLAPAPGTFFSGQIEILSGVTLLVQPGARLLASANVSDYPASAWAFLYASGASDIGVTGGGVVDGNFEAYVAGYDAPTVQLQPRGWPGCSGECRPRLAQFIDTQRVAVSAVTFTGSPDWTFHLLNCSYVHVFNWTQHGDERWPNNDGIDIDSSSHVLLEDSTIDTADDGVCIKGSAVGGVSVNVTVRNCRVRSRSSAIKYGSNCPIPMSGHVFEDIEVFDSNRALALQARDGGLLSNITFRRISITGTRLWPWKWWGDGGPICE